MRSHHDEFLRYVLEQLTPLRELSAAGFFGGTGIKAGTAMFAMIMDGTLYFATDEATRPEYVALGGRRFSYRTKSRLVETKFFEVPADILDDRERLAEFAERAIAVVRATSHARTRGRRKQEG
jgi:DNA transformation protein